MAELDILYQELIDMGFERYDYTDSVFYRQFGRNPFVMDFKLSKNIKIEINCDMDEATLYKANKRPFKDNYEAFMKLNSRKEIQLTVAVFGHVDQAKVLNKEVSNG